MRTSTHLEQSDPESCAVSLSPVAIAIPEDVLCPLPAEHRSWLLALSCLSSFSWGLSIFGACPCPQASAASQNLPVWSGVGVSHHRDAVSWW